MDISEFVAFTADQLDGGKKLQASGGILYSAAATLAPGDIYILGLNPGGTGGASLAEDLKALPRKTSNAYLEEAWSNEAASYKPGAAPLQRRVEKLASALGYRLSEVCASNLIFMQSRTDKGIAYPDDADICWPIHEKILEIVCPKLILTFGNSLAKSSYCYLRQKFLGANREDIFPSGHGSWKCRGFEAEINKRPTYIAGLPHLSRYSPLDATGSVRQTIAHWLAHHLRKQ